MNEKALSPASIQSMLQTLRAAQAQAQDGVGLPSTIQAPGTQAPAGFGQLVKNAVSEVNTLQQNSRALQSFSEAVFTFDSFYAEHGVTTTQKQRN